MNALCTYMRCVFMYVVLVWPLAGRPFEIRLLANMSPACMYLSLPA